MICKTRFCLFLFSLCCLRGMGFHRPGDEIGLYYFIRVIIGCKEYSVTKRIHTSVEGHTK